MDNLVGRLPKLSDGTIRLPNAVLVCNQTPPTADALSLMTTREVETLFHEFGHGLQHMLTTVDLAQAVASKVWSGTPWNSSQFMENWTLRTYRHGFFEAF